jgi:hypothetical protein
VPTFHLRWWFALEIGAVQNWLKAQPRNFFLTELKNLWNAGTDALKSKGITL